MRYICAAFALLLTLQLAAADAAADEKDAANTRFPATLVIHGGYRPTMAADVTMYRLAVTSCLYSFFGQFDKTPREALEASIWVDASSYEGHINVLEGVLHNLQELVQEINDDYVWVKFSIHFSRGIAETYHRSLRLCEEKPWCSYVMFVEDDWMFHHPNIKHSAMELVNIMNSNDMVNYIRFNKRTINGILFDSPCVVQDGRLPIPLTHTAGFSNNAHLCRVSAIQKLFDITHDARQAANDWGLECHEDMGKMGMFALCHNLVYACPAQRPFVQDPGVCDYKKYVQNHGCADTNWATETFKQMNATSCTNDDGREPRYDHCGLYIYGEYQGAQTTAHLQGDGKTFDADAFWANPTSFVDNSPLPYVKPPGHSGHYSKFMSRLKHIAAASY